MDAHTSGSPTRTPQMPPFTAISHMIDDFLLTFVLALEGTSPAAWLCLYICLMALIAFHGFRTIGACVFYAWCWNPKRKSVPYTASSEVLLPLSPPDSASAMDNSPAPVTSPHAYQANACPTRARAHVCRTPTRHARHEMLSSSSMSSPIRVVVTTACAIPVAMPTQQLSTRVLSSKRAWG